MSRAKDPDAKGKRKPLLSRRESVVSVLDVGSSKVACLIARMTPREPDQVLPGRTHDVQVLGYGMQRARGMKSGVVINLEQAEQSIRLAVEAAERMAGVTVESLIVSLTCGRLRSTMSRASIELGGREVSEADVKRVLGECGTRSVQPDVSIVHSVPVNFALDAAKGIRDPKGMAGRALSGELHVVSADTAPLRNLEYCVNRCHLEVAAMVASPYASALATLADDEAELGVACVDMGGGTTSIAVFADNQFVHVDSLAVGGHHVTTDIARTFSTRFADAERIKTLYGSALPSLADDREMIAVPPVGDDGHDMMQVPKGTLTRVIRPRVEEILEMVRDRLVASGHSARVGKRVVLTGGASQLTGLVEVARRILGHSVRLGRPLGIAGLPQVAKGSAFAAAVGLLIYPQVAQGEVFETRTRRVASTGTGGYFDRLGQWIKESF